MSVTILLKTAANITGNVNINSFKRESMTFREGVDLMVDRAALAMKLSPDAIKLVKVCIEKTIDIHSRRGTENAKERKRIKQFCLCEK